jgi:hypothetical protein
MNNEYKKREELNIKRRGESYTGGSVQTQL